MQAEKKSINLTSAGLNNQLKNKLKRTMEIIASGDDYISKLEQFSRVLTEEEQSLFNKYPLLDMIRFAFWDFAVLEICKLFNPKEDLSLSKTLNLVINNYSKINWKHKIALEEFNTLSAKLKQKSILIARIKKIRDNCIAHYCKNDYSDYFTISEFRELFDLSQLIYNKIELALNGSEMSWDFKYDTMDMKLVKNLYKFESLREFICKNDFKGEKFVTTESLIKILS